MFSVHWKYLFCTLKQNFQHNKDLFHLLHTIKTKQVILERHITTKVPGKLLFGNKATLIQVLRKLGINTILLFRLDF